MQPTPVAILVSDLHLSEKAPKNRAEKGKDWYKAMESSLTELTLLRIKFDNIPILCAGDIFDKWDSNAELINFAIARLPRGMYCVPGQHDLPNHNTQEIHRSAYWTLVGSETIENLSSGAIAYDGVFMQGFGWNEELSSPSPVNKEEGIRVAVVHKYCWNKGNNYPGARNSEHVKSHVKKLKGFDAAVFGDNHKHFSCTVRKTSVWNNGLFMPRKIDEKDVIPRVGVLYSDKSIKSVELETKAKWVDQPEPEDAAAVDNTEVKKFVRSLLKVQKDSIDFKEMLIRGLKLKGIVDEEVKQIILESLE